MSAATKGPPAPPPTSHRDNRDRVDRFHRTRLFRALYHLTRRLVRLLLVPLARITVHGAGRVPKEGPLVVASNHLHNFDPVILGAVLPRNLFYMAKKELFAVPILAQLIRFYGGFPIDRGAADRAALRYATHVVEDGQALFMFPEGTRSATGKIERVLPGAAFVAVRTGAPILPVAITGTQTLPLDEKRAHAGRVWNGRADVTVTVGEPFHVRAGTDGKRPDMRAATDEIMCHVAALLPPAYRGIFADAGGAAVAVGEGDRVGEDGL